MCPRRLRGLARAGRVLRGLREAARRRRFRVRRPAVRRLGRGQVDAPAQHQSGRCEPHVPRSARVERLRARRSGQALGRAARRHLQPPVQRLRAAARPHDRGPRGARGALDGPRRGGLQGRPRLRAQEDDVDVPQPEPVGGRVPGPLRPPRQRGRGRPLLRAHGPRKNPAPRTMTVDDVYLDLTAFESPSKRPAPREYPPYVPPSF
mmetsp:Transcript_13328/g.39696  ORF Transcript_13328/g.39696 Transcript_13328/m.39696 type:complete len:206 (+) Transcript_13328:432-1049(+)